MRLSLAVWGMGAAVMAALVASCMYWGIGFCPLAWVGQVFEKWSLGLLQHGQMNQWDDLGVFEILLGVL